MVYFVITPSPGRQSVKEGGTLKFRIEIKNPDYDKIGSYKIFWKAEPTRDNAATPGALGVGDYNAVRGGDLITRPQVILFEKGDKYVEIEIETYRDLFVEGSEYLEINLFDYRGKFLQGSGKVFTIEDRNKAPDPPRLRIETLESDKDEGDGQTTFTFRVTRDGDDLNSFTTVTWRVGSNGSSGATTSDFDYNGRWPEGSVSFGPGDEEKIIRVKVDGDRRQEADETFYVDLISATGGATIATSRASGVIRNDDEEAPPPPPPEPQGPIYVNRPFYEHHEVTQGPRGTTSHNEGDEYSAAWDFDCDGADVVSIGHGRILDWDFSVEDNGDGDSHGLGNFITIVFNEGGASEFFATYAHLAHAPGGYPWMSGPLTVSPGDYLAISGNTGLTTNPNLHVQYSREKFTHHTGAIFAKATDNYDDLVVFTSHFKGDARQNRLVGSERADDLDGGAGADTMEGKAGDDDFQVENAGDIVVETAEGGFDSVYSHLSYALSDHADRLILRGVAVEGTGNADDNALYGNDQANRLEGRAGADILDGLVGADVMVGGTGDDIYVVDAAGDQTMEAAGEGADIVFSGIDWMLSQSTEILVLTAAAAEGRGNGENNRIYGTDGANRLFGLDGDDLLIGGQGADEMAGGLGDDQFIVDDIGDVVVEVTDGGNDTIFSYRNLTLANGVETLVFIAEAGLTGVGNALDNHLQGHGGNDVLEGLNGNDALVGLAGADVMRGGVGDDRYVVDNIGDITEEAAGGGADVVFSEIGWTLGAHLETLVLLGNTSLTGHGNSADNLLFANSADCTLDGGLGDDTLVGGTGEDTFVASVGTDVIYGGGGGNVATFTGNKAEYKIFDWGGWTYIKGNGGLTLLNGVALAKFADGEVDLNLVINSPSFDASASGEIWSAGLVDMITPPPQIGAFASDYLVLPTASGSWTTPTYQGWDGFDPFESRSSEADKPSLDDAIICPPAFEVGIGAVEDFEHQGLIQRLSRYLDRDAGWRDGSVLV